MHSTGENLLKLRPTAATIWGKFPSAHCALPSLFNFGVLFAPYA